MLRLCYTPNSPYARIARVAIYDAGLADRTDFIAVQTRDAKTNLFQITPLARVPCLEHQGRLIADTRDICHYIDGLLETPQWLPPENGTTQTQRQIATGLLDSIAIWLRENARPTDTRSQIVLDYEVHRVCQILLWFEAHFDTIFTPEDRWDFTTLTLAVALDIAQMRGMNSVRPKNAPRLLEWLHNTVTRPSMRKTAPLPQYATERPVNQ